MRRNNTFRTSVALAAATALLGACSDSSADDDDTADQAPSSSSPAADKSVETSAPTEEIDLPDGVTALPDPDTGEDFATLGKGRYRVPLSDSLSFDVAVPSESYAHDGGLFIATGPVVLKTEVAGETYGVPDDPCTASQIVPAGPTVDDLVEAIRSQQAYEVSDPAPVEIGDARGTFLEIRIAAVDAGSPCSGEVQLPGLPATALSWGSDYRSHWWILDVDGQRVVVAQNCTCDVDRLDRAIGIAESITFTPTP